VELIRELKEISKEDVAVAGGKGASLGEMIQAGIPVPNGFVVLSNAFEQFLKETDLNVEIDAALDEVNTEEMHTIEDASEKIKAMVLGQEIPKDIAKEINKHFKELDSKFVAVRSSATSEDSASAAWAGQLETYLNTTEKDLLENVKKCWASLFTPRAIFYRFEQKLDKKKISVAVVVQKMVESEESGIAFSVHPVTQDKNQLIIEAGYGLGEAIVSGQITPDSYVVDKQNWNVLDINVSEQSKGLFRKQDEGNEWKELGEDGKKQVLNEKEIIELSKLIIKIEDHYGFPVDIEWAKEKGEFYITQSRPITTLDKDIKSKKAPVIFDKFLSRPYSVLQIEAYNQFLTEISEEINYQVPYPFFVYDPNQKLVTLYYDMKELLPGLAKIGEKITKESKFRKKVFSKSLRVFEQVKKYFDGDLAVNSMKEFQDFFWLFKDYMKYVAYTRVLPGLDFVPKEIRNEAMRIREKTEDYAGRRDSIMIDFANSVINDRQVNPFFLSLDEIKKRDDVKKKSKDRKNGFLFYKGEIILSKEIPNFLESQDIILKDPEIKDTSEIRGAIAQKGIVKGIVKIVYTEDELNKINKGDILVTPMTRPEFIPVMRKTGAIVTDEGGVVCHAAIVAREMKKSCIIGTKIATKVLKDGDLVEVDANIGVVKIIGKEENKAKESETKWNVVRSRYIPASYPFLVYFSWPVSELIPDAFFNVIHAWENGNVQAIWGEECSKGLRKGAVEILMKNKTNLKNLRKKGQPDGEKLIRFCEKFAKRAYEGQLKDYLNFFKEFGILYRGIMKNNMLLWVFGNVPLERKVNELLSHHNEIERKEIMEIMSITTEASYSKIEEEKFEKIVEIAREKGLGSKKVKEEIRK